MKNKKIDCYNFLIDNRATIDKDLEKIRIVKSAKFSFSGRTTYTYAYLELKDGIIVNADYGLGKYKGIELTNCKECWENNPKLRMKNIFTGEDC